MVGTTLHKDASVVKSYFVKTSKPPRPPLVFFGVVPFKRLACILAPPAEAKL